MSNIIVVHGSYGSPFINWFPWLYNQRNNVIIPQFPVGKEKQNYANWSELLNYYNKMGYINSDTILIGHSIAPIFIIKYLTANQIKVKRLIFIAGFNNYFLGNGDYDVVNESFFIEDIQLIKSCCDDIVCFYADNDPYIPYNELKLFADEVATKQHLIRNGGHLNGESGYLEFKEILEYVGDNNGY